MYAVAFVIVRKDDKKVLIHGRTCTLVRYDSSGLANTQRVWTYPTSGLSIRYGTVSVCSSENSLMRLAEAADSLPAITPTDAAATLCRQVQHQVTLKSVQMSGNIVVHATHLSLTKKSASGLKSASKMAT